MTAHSPDEVLMTRRQLAAWLSAQGYPLSYSTITKMCSPAISSGPPVDCWWGRLPMHRPSVALEWARARLRPNRTPAAERAMAAAAGKRGRRPREDQEAASAS